MEYLIHLAIIALLTLLLAQSFNLLHGYARLLSLAHISTYALGAYTTAILSVYHGVGMVGCLIASSAVGVAGALMVALIARRLRGDSFVMGTLAWAALISALTINWRSLTNGVLGIPGIPRPIIGGYELVENREFLLLALSISTVLLAAIWMVMRGPLGRALRATGEFEYGAAALGLEREKMVVLALGTSAIGAAVSGSLYAYYLNYIDPSSFMLNEMVAIMAIVVIGAPGSFWGCIGATIFVLAVPEILRFVPMAPGVLGPLRQAIFGGMLLVALWVQRNSLMPPAREV